MNKLMKDIIHDADNFAKNCPYGEFNYSIESLHLVEQAIDDIEKEIEQSNEEMIYNISSAIGCYVFEVARRNYGGVYYWESNGEQPILVAGEPDFAVTLHAWEKVKQRLLNGKADNIPFYVAGYKEHIEKGKNQKGYYVNVT